MLAQKYVMYWMLRKDNLSRGYFRKTLKGHFFFEVFFQIIPPIILLSLMKIENGLYDVGG